MEKYPKLLWGYINYTGKLLTWIVVPKTPVCVHIWSLRIKKLLLKLLVPVPYPTLKKNFLFLTDPPIPNLPRIAI